MGRAVLIYIRKDNVYFGAFFHRADSGTSCALRCGVALSGHNARHLSDAIDAKVDHPCPECGKPHIGSQKHQEITYYDNTPDRLHNDV